MNIQYSPIKNNKLNQRLIYKKNYIKILGKRYIQNTKPSKKIYKGIRYLK